MFNDQLIGLQMSDSDIDIVVHTWSITEDNPIFGNALVEAVIDGMDK